MSQQKHQEANTKSNTVKPKRRSTGQIKKVGPGRYQMRLFIGFDAKGKRHYKIETRHCTAKQAERTLRDWALARDNGELQNPSMGLLADWMEQWLTHWSTQVRPVTLAQYRMLIRTYVIPGLGSMPVAQLKPAHIREWTDQLSARGLSRTTVRAAYWVLSRALKTLVEQHELKKSPCSGIAVKKTERPESSALTPDQVITLVEAAKGTLLEALWLVLLSTGVRPAEALALRWKDLQGETLRVRESVSKTAAGFHFNPPKTKAGKRSVPLGAVARDALQRRKAAIGAADDDALIFATRDGGPLEWRVIVRRHWTKLLKAAGIPAIKPYALRHTNTSLLLETQCSLPEIKRRLGHTSVEFLIDTYGHALGDIPPATRQFLRALIGHPAP